jgi:acetyl-CoA synthetase
MLYFRKFNFTLSRVLSVAKNFPAVPVPGQSVKESRNAYLENYKRSVEDPEGFWSEKANAFLTWTKPFTKALTGDFAEGTAKWFEDGQLNACFNAVDRHVADKGNQAAIIWDGDEPGTRKVITYAELQEEVSKIANVMKSKGVKKGDVVTIYMPMIPQLPIVMLACARIGAIHSVVFAGFSIDSLQDRIQDCNSKFVFAADEGKRGGKLVPLKKTVDTAVAACPNVETVFVFKHTGNAVNMQEKRDVWMHDLLPSVSKDCPVEPMNSEDPLFILYTSGSTGKPKGILHTTGGYLLYAGVTAKTTFDLRKDDVFCCVADCGWVTGHTYIVYGPLVNGSTTVMFESIPTYPTPYRYWELAQVITYCFVLFCLIQKLLIEC